MPEPRTVQPQLVLVDREGTEERYLLELHDKWRAFMFPVTRPRQFQDAEWGLNLSEEPADAACRAVAETVGSIVRHDQLQHKCRVATTDVSFRLGSVTGYQFEVYQYRLGRDETISPPRPVVWLTLEKIMDPNLVPISPAAIAVTQQLIDPSRS